MSAGRSWVAPFAALVDPHMAMNGAIRAPHPWRSFTVVAIAWVVLGVGTLPRQLALLGQAIAPGGADAAAPHLRALASGLTRLIIVDRLVPLPSVVLAAVLLYLAAEPVLVLPTSRRRELISVIVIGLTPLVILRAVELVLTWSVHAGTGISLGEVLRLPHRFAFGAALLWRHGGPAPAVLEILEARVNLFSLWTAGLWAYGLTRLDTGGVRAWHALLPVVCLGVAGILTWASGPIVLAGVLALGR